MQKTDIETGNSNEIVVYNENEDEYFLSIINAIKKKLSIAQLKINVPVESPVETAIEVNVGDERSAAADATDGRAQAGG